MRWNYLWWRFLCLYILRKIPIYYELYWPSSSSHILCKLLIQNLPVLPLHIFRIRKYLNLSCVYPHTFSPFIDLLIHLSLTLELILLKTYVSIFCLNIFSSNIFHCSFGSEYTPRMQSCSTEFSEHMPWRARHSRKLVAASHLETGDGQMWMRTGQCLWDFSHAVCYLLHWQSRIGVHACANKWAA